MVPEKGSYVGDYVVHLLKIPCITSYFVPNNWRLVRHARERSYMVYNTTHTSKNVFNAVLPFHHSSLLIIYARKSILP